MLRCPFCGWEPNLFSGSDPADIVLGGDDHLDEHVEEMITEPWFST